jgi:hypothetical protein
MRLFFAIALLLVPIAELRAGSFENAHAGLSKAYNDFFTAAKNSSGSQEELSRLSKQIVSPAVANMNQVMKESQSKVMRDIRAGRLRSPDASLRKSGLSKGAVPVSAPKVAPQNPVSPPKPKLILDGSKVPRELDFSGPKKASPQETH